MSATILGGPRSSTPKRGRTRLLPNIPDASKSESKQQRTGRKLPPIPAIKPIDKPRQGPYPNGTTCIRSDQNQGIPKHLDYHQNSSLPNISNTSRQLPKLPDDIGKRQSLARKQTIQHNKTEDKKEKLHDVYKSEADDMFKQGQLDKALELYNAALKMISNNKTTYVARSRCFKEMGKIRKAMQDVETALTLDPLYYEALFQKGELLFNERDFESALIYYNKGMQQRPEMKSFHERITKTQNAMITSGSKLTNKLKKSGELSMVLPNKMKNFAQKPTPKIEPEKTSNSRKSSRKRRTRKNPFICSSKTKSHNIYQQSDDDEKRIKEALGQMYNDKEYLERVLEQAGKLSRGSVDLCTMAEKGLNFLYDRVLFWVRQENGIPLDTKITLAESIEKQLTQRSSSVDSTYTEPPRLNGGLQVLGNSIPLGNIKQQGLETARMYEEHSRQKTKREKIRSIRNSNTEFFDVLSGQKVELIDTDRKKHGEQTFLIEGRPKILEPVIQRDATFVKGLENSTFSNNDSDSGINMSFSTCRESSDPDQFDPVQIRTIQEEYLTKLQSPDKKILKQRKKVERRLKLRSDTFSEYISTAMETIETAFIGGRYKDCITRARPVLAALNRYNEECDEPIPNSVAIEAKLHSYIGNAAIEIRDYPTALHHHQRDLEIGEDCNDEVIVSRALGNLGRIFVFKNQHQEALELFSRKIPLCKTNVETAWLYHEIGNCFLVLTQYAFAREAARRSIEAADAEEERSYQLQSCVLKGVAEVKLREYHSAFNTFERAMKQARLQGDVTAEESIREALLDVNERILEEIRTKDQGEERLKSRNSYGGSRMVEILPEVRELSSFDIYEDDGPVSLSDTRCDTYDLHSELGHLHHDLDTGMTGSMQHFRTISSHMSRVTPDSRRLSTCNPQSSRRPLLPQTRCNTVN